MQHGLSLITKTNIACAWVQVLETRIYIYSPLVPVKDLW